MSEIPLMSEAPAGFQVPAAPRTIEGLVPPRPAVMAFHWLARNDGRTEFPWVGSGCRELLGLEAAALMADPALFWERVHPEDRTPLKLAELKARRQGSTLHHVCRLLVPEGDCRLIAIVASPISPDGVLWHALAQDISEQQRRIDELEDLRQALERQECQLQQKARLLAEAHAAIVRLSTTDALTGLPNRLHFEQSLLRAVGLAQRQGRPLTLLRFDLRGLRQLNRRWGTLAGDRAIRRFAGVLAHGLSQEHSAARLGAGEFALLFPDVDLSDSQVLRKSLVEAWEEAQALDGVGLRLAIGSAGCLADDSPDSLLRRADEQLG